MIPANERYWSGCRDRLEAALGVSARLLGMWRRSHTRTEIEAKDLHLFPSPYPEEHADGLTVFLMHAPTCRFYRISPLAADLIGLAKCTSDEASAYISRFGRTIPPRVLRAAFEDVELLLGQLAAEPRPSLEPPGVRHGYNLSLNAGMACNLACSYCDPFDYRRATHGQRMTEETAEKAMEFFFSRVPKDSDGCVTYSIGGEPLLYRRLLDFVASYTRQLRESGVRATQYLSTNGLLLSDGVIEYLRLQDIRFGLSMDGPPEAHDAHRVLPNGQGTYAAVREAAERVLSAFPHTAVSAVLTAAFPHPLTVYRHLLELGFERIIVKPVRGRPSEAHAFTRENLGALCDGYKEYARYYVEELVSGRREIFAAINPHDYFSRWVIRMLQQERRGYRCGAGSMGNLTVSPDGSFYPCEGFVGLDEFRLGNVEDGFDDEAMARFTRLYVDDKPGCQDCWARYQCGGGCYLSGLMVNGDIARQDPVECELNRFLTELAIWTLDTVAERRPGAIGELRSWCQKAGWYGTETLLAKTFGARRRGFFELPVLGAQPADNNANSAAAQEMVG